MTQKHRIEIPSVCIGQAYASALFDLLDHRQMVVETYERTAAAEVMVLVKLTLLGK